jgi:hypothetical protein
MYRKLATKLLEERWNDLYKFMCNMLEAMTKEDFNEVYGRFKTTHTNDVDVLKYLEKRWVGDGSLWKLM